MTQGRRVLRQKKQVLRACGAQDDNASLSFLKEGKEKGTDGQRARRTIWAGACESTRKAWSPASPSRRLVYFEGFADIREAIAREKQIKGWVRSRKIKLIEERNARWDDLDP